MSETTHPEPDLLLQVALGEADVDASTHILGHVSDCAGCRRELGDLTEGIDAVLPAVPRTAPPPGFEARVLDRLGVERSADPADAAESTSRPRGRVLIPAAAGLAGLAVGAGIVWGALEASAPEEPQSAEVPVTTEAGQQVGQVSRAYGETGAMFVIALDEGGDVGAVTCLVRLADGRTHEAGEWILGDDGGGTWVIEEQSPGVEEILLIDDAGDSWATADL